MSADFSLANVFLLENFSGNPLPVVFTNHASTSDLQKLAREFNQTETVYINEMPDGAFETRIFTVDSEIPFAGHPLIGAAAVIHQRKQSKLKKTAKICLYLPFSNRKISLTSDKIEATRYHVSMEQGNIETYKSIGSENSDLKEIFRSMNIMEEDLIPHLPVVLISTGLPYVMIPVKEKTLENLTFQKDITANLRNLGADYSYVFTLSDDKAEARSFDNFGKAEDPATGSAAGPLGYYLVHNKLRRKDTMIPIHQGRFCGRSSVLTVRIDQHDHIFVSGDVMIVGHGQYHL